MTELDAEWYRRVARMEREELVDTLEREAKLREQALAELDNERSEHAATIEIKDGWVSQYEKLKSVDMPKAVAEAVSRPLYFIASSNNHAGFAMQRMNRDPRREHIVNTNNLSTISKLRGTSLTADDFRLVRGYRKGKYLANVEQAIAPMGVTFGDISYAPDPYFEAIEDGSYDDAIIEEYKKRGGDEIALGSTINIEKFGPARVTGASADITMGDKRISLDCQGVYVNKFVPKDKIVVMNPDAFGIITNSY